MNAKIIKLENISENTQIFFKNNSKIIAICAIIVFAINIVDIVIKNGNLPVTWY